MRKTGMTVAMLILLASSANADKFETKPLPTRSIPTVTRHVICVLKMSIGMHVPTSFGSGTLRTRPPQAWILASPRENKDIDVQTIRITIKPITSSPGMSPDDLVEDGAVEVLRTYVSPDGLQSMTEHYQNSQATGAVSFRSDHLGHLVLRSGDERMALDFGTGLLQRTVEFGPSAWRTDIELYACSTDTMKQLK